MQRPRDTYLYDSVTWGIQTIIRGVKPSLKEEPFFVVLDSKLTPCGLKLSVVGWGGGTVEHLYPSGHFLYNIFDNVV